jgi:hypothetical protein
LAEEGTDVLYSQLFFADNQREVHKYFINVIRNYEDDIAFSMPIYASHQFLGNELHCNE